MSDNTKGDLLYGVKAIAGHLGVTERRAQYLKDKKVIPHFYIDSTVCSRRSLLDEWLDKAAQAATEGRRGEPAATVFSGFY